MGRRPSYLPSEDSTNLDRRDLNSNLNNDEDSHSSVQLMGLDLARQNSKKACIRRSFVIALLVIVAVLVTVFLQQSSNNREEDIFETEFDVLSLKLTENFLSVFEIKIWTSFSVSVSITSDALYYNRSTSWPNVLVPNFDLRMKATHQTQTTQQQQQQQQQSNTILFAPLVADNNRVSWESFVVQNQDQVAVKPNDDRTLADGIYMPGPDGTRIRDPGPGPYFPAFLISTSNPKDNARHILTNYYGVPTFRRIYDTLIKTEASVISEISQTDDDVPLSVLFTPVFDRTESPKSVVGVIQQDVDWRSHFQAVTPNQGSVIAVLETGAGEILSFEISEDSVKYLGQGDRHDSKYDDYLVTSEVSTGSLRDSTKDTIWNQDAYSSGIIALAIPASQDEAVSPESLDYTTGTFSYILSVYPTQCFEDAYKTNLPMIYTVVAAVVFALIIILFIIHDKLFERRQQRPMEPAVRFGKVVNSLFPPGGLQTRLFPKEAKEERIQERAVVVRWPSFRRLMSNDDSLRVMEPAKTRLRSFLNHSEQKDLAELEQYQYEDPIADLFPETTIMFADISGFTAWSSEREPSQVFYLLETLYRAFDQLASRLGVFKVDTIGDCYVAVTGLPDPNKDHAVVMARFSYECLLEMSELVKSLEVTLGPGTSDLAIRVGIHSGPVTAGVLRGEKARFQLFGDTMNTASRMECTGEQHRIHVSQDTAMLLKRAGKEHWLNERDGIVNVKGKGEMKTWWLQPRRAHDPPYDHAAAIERMIPPPEARIHYKYPRRSSKNSDNWGNLTLDSYGVDADKKARLVNWNVEIFGELLSKVVAWRSIRAQTPSRRRRSDNSLNIDMSLLLDSLDGDDDEPTTAFDEVSEVIKFPSFSENATLLGTLVPDPSRLTYKVKAQLHHFISRIADCYHNVPFHNLEHASHVTLSANKLMKRIISPDESDFTQADEESRRRLRRRRSFGDIQNNLESVERNLHTSTFGISSDPLCQLAIVFSALIHDVDHTGVPNAQLVKEKVAIAAKYHDKSVAEQNSVDISWEILMDHQYQDLRYCIFENETERRRFRQLVVNSVMATDIVDKELKLLRENRWATAFDESKFGSMSDTDVNRKATIVIEHIIQASDVAHTMQHWHIYIKWNEKLFCEMYTAYLSGRAAKDPSEGWYGGEIWFFDNYIIPLAKKLKECGVFGVASDEYLGFALENREEWLIKGKAVVATMLLAYQKRHGGQTTTVNKPPEDGAESSSSTAAAAAEGNAEKELELSSRQEPSDGIDGNIVSTTAGSTELVN